MPRKTRHQRHGPQEPGRQATPRRGRQGTWPVGRNHPPTPWFRRSTVRNIGLSGLVGGAVVALVVFAVLQSSSSDFEFSMYQESEDLGGSNLKFAQMFPTEKPVVLNFWAGLCPICRVDMPIYQQIYELHQEKIIFLGLDIGPFVGLSSHRDARNLLRELNITYPAGYVHNRDALTKFGITGTPTIIFLTANGEVFRKRPGYLDHATMAGMIQDLLSASAISS